MSGDLEVVGDQYVEHGIILDNRHVLQCYKRVRQYPLDLRHRYIGHKRRKRKTRHRDLLSFAEPCYVDCALRRFPCQAFDGIECAPEPK